MESHTPAPRRHCITHPRPRPQQPPHHLQSGVVQCVLPIHFDQPFWAAEVVSRGLGCAPTARLQRILDDCDEDGPERWADRLADMIQAQLRTDSALEARRSAYATALTAECGVENAVAEIARVQRDRGPRQAG